MIEKIYIPTVHRVDQQITYNNLPGELKKLVVFVVQAWEREQYKYDAEYLVLPDTEEYHYSHYYCLSKTRKIIYDSGQHIKYAMLDDDVTFGRRNAKYWAGISSMEKSKRNATEQDVLDMFCLYDSWLDSVTVCGCAHAEFPPSSKPYRNNSSLSSALWINGNHFRELLQKLDLTSTRVAQDVVFLLSLLTNGFSNRVSEEFVFYNKSISKNSMKSTQWNEVDIEKIHEDHKKIEKMFPDIFTVLYDDSGKRVAGGFRDVGKVKIQWNKAYKTSQENNSSILEFFK